MKEKRTYRRVDLPSALAILGCAGMILFECIFIFELYDHVVSQPVAAVPVPSPLDVEGFADPAPLQPVPEKTGEPVLTVPVETNSAPASVPVG